MKKIIKPKNTTRTCEEMSVSEWICYLNSKPGVPGPEGPVGPSGPEGAIGPMGPQGVQGPAGPQGPKGDQGIQGVIGPVGPKGDTGPQGVVGPQGPKGDQGGVGPAGPQGSQGPIGPAGPIGPKGDKGDAGPIGATGAVGPQGAKGDQGVPGPQGPQGVPGAQGPQGQAATIAVGTVTPVPCTNPPKITNIGTPTNAVFNFETPAYACTKYAGFNSNNRATYTENQPLLYDRFTTNSPDIVGNDGGTSFTLLPAPAGYTRSYAVYFTSNMKYSAAPGLASIGLFANGTEIFRVRHYFNDPNQFETVEWTNLVAPAEYEWRVIPGVAGATLDTLDILNNITEVTQLA